MATKVEQTTNEVLHFIGNFNTKDKNRLNTELVLSFCVDKAQSVT